MQEQLQLLVYRNVWCHRVRGKADLCSEPLVLLLFFCDEVQ